MAAPATFYATVGGNDTYWRVDLPARFLGAKACVVREAEYRVFQAPHDFDPFPWSATDEGEFAYPAHEGVAVWTRPDFMRAKHILAMRSEGIPTAAEVDDNYLSATHLNLFMRANGYDDNAREEHLASTATADRVILATRWLRDRYHKALREALGRGNVPELAVARNHYDLADQPEREPYDGPLRVGWMGSPQHVRDIKLVARAFCAAQDLGCETIVMGHDVRDLTGVTDPVAREETEAWGRLITRHIPWVDPAEYHRSALPFDIGVAPLEYNDHTLGKSDVKALEYAMSGAVPVLQNHPVYSAEWRHNETCLLAGSPAEFEHHVRELVRNRGLRERLVSAAQQYVREERSNEVATKEWGEAIG